MKKNPSAARVMRPLDRLSVSGFLLLAFVLRPFASSDSSLTAQNATSLHLLLERSSYWCRVPCLFVVIPEGNLRLILPLSVLYTIS